MDAVIVAAGESSRLYPRTLETPKCLLEVGGEPLIDRNLRLLEEAGVEDVYVVLGFQAEKLEAHLEGRAKFIYNPFYASTNNMASLWMALPAIDSEELLYSHSDLIFEPEILFENIRRWDRESVALIYDPESIHEEAMKVRLRDGKFEHSSKEIALDNAAGEWIGLTFFSRSGLESFQSTARRLLLEEEFNAYDTAAFNRMAADGLSFQTLETDGRAWKEIDTEADLTDARERFGEAR